MNLVLASCHLSGSDHVDGSTQEVPQTIGDSHDKVNRKVPRFVPRSRRKLRGEFSQVSKPVTAAGPRYLGPEP